MSVTYVFNGQVALVTGAAAGMGIANCADEFRDERDNDYGEQ